MDVMFFFIIIVLLPTACLFFSALAVSFYIPNEKISRIAQYFAAGCVFSAVAIELLPLMRFTDSRSMISSGFLLGICLMLLIKRVTLKAEAKIRQRLIVGQIANTGIDLFICGILLGISQITGLHGGVFMAIALAFEILFMGLTSAIVIAKHSYGTGRRLLMASCLLIFVPMGGIVGALLLNSLPKPMWPAIMAFSIAALLYLVIEELLASRHENSEIPWLPAIFLFGFFGILAVLP